MDCIGVNILVVVLLSIIKGITLRGNQVKGSIQNFYIIFCNACQFKIVSK